MLSEHDPQFTESGDISEHYLAEVNEHEHFADHFLVNGIDMSIMWDDGYHDYVLYFPDLPLNDQVLRLGIDQRSAATAVFDKAQVLAEQLDKGDAEGLKTRLEGAMDSLK